MATLYGEKELEMIMADKEAKQAYLDLLKLDLQYRNREAKAKYDDLVSRTSESKPKPTQVESHKDVF